jgi:addiction module RelB/DinJ family antitoxin
MATIVAGVVVYFGRWTKAALALVIGVAMIALAETLPDHGTLIGQFRLGRAILPGAVAEKSHLLLAIPRCTWIVDGNGRAGQIVRMSEATAIVRTRVPTRRLQRAERVLRKLGLTPADAVNMLLAQIEIRQGLPFEVRVQGRNLLSSEDQAAAWTEAFGAY